ncbi:MAG: Transposase [Acidobacteriaceae bacterium]|nr:Transposase [Acidobacteriaceae bacterium]
MIACFAEQKGRQPVPVGADTTYGNGEFLQWLMDRGITPYMRTRDSALRKNNPLDGPERFTYLPKSNSYLYPAGKQRASRSKAGCLLSVLRPDEDQLFALHSYKYRRRSKASSLIPASQPVNSELKRGMRLARVNND